MGSETEPEVGLSRSSSLKPLAAHPFLPAALVVPLPSPLFPLASIRIAPPPLFARQQTTTTMDDDSVVPVLVTRRQTPTLKTARRAAALSRLSSCVRRCIHACVCVWVGVGGCVCGIPGRHPRLVVARSIN